MNRGRLHYSVRQSRRARLRIVLASCSLFSWLAWARSAAAQDAALKWPGDSGAFEIISGKDKIGTEKFQIKATANGWEATGELQLAAPGGAKTSETSILRLEASLRPSYYERVQKSPISARLVAQVGATETLLEISDQDEPFQQIFYLPPNNLVILDTNFFHHYDLLLRLYDRDKGMAQTFNVFIPQEALPGTINLQYMETETVSVGQSRKTLDHFQGTTDQLQMEIWATPEGAIQRISIPQANLEVVRQ